MQSVIPSDSGNTFVCREIMFFACYLYLRIMVSNTIFVSCSLTRCLISHLTLVGSCCSILVLCNVMLIIIHPFVIFLLVIVLFVLRFTDSDPFGIFKFLTDQKYSHLDRFSVKRCLSHINSVVVTV